MKLYIQIKDGAPVNHPHLMENVIQMFGHIPKDWAPFIRTELNVSLMPPLKPFQKHVSIYELSSDGISWTDSQWLAVDLSDEEKQKIISTRKNNPPGPNVIFDEETAMWIPNTPKPDSETPLIWSNSSGTWEKAA